MLDPERVSETGFPHLEHDDPLPRLGAADPRMNNPVICDPRGRAVLAVYRKPFESTSFSIRVSKSCTWLCWSNSA